MPAIDSAAVGRHVQAAILLAGRTLDDVAPELNISRRTLARAVAGERQLRDWELKRLAELLPVPEWFLREGFAGEPAGDERSELAELDDRLARRHDEIVGRLDDQGEMLRTLMARVEGNSRRE